MSDEIVNKVAQSPLITFNLESFLPPKVLELDLSQFLEEGYLLREKEYRAHIKALDLAPFAGNAVRLYCSTDALLPSWAPLLLSTALQTVNAKAYWAESESAFYELWFRDQLAFHAWSQYENRPVILKGCGDPRVPTDAYVCASQHLKRVAKKLSYGEACSAVPLK